MFAGTGSLRTTAPIIGRCQMKFRDLHLHVHSDDSPAEIATSEGKNQIRESVAATL